MKNKVLLRFHRRNQVGIEIIKKNKKFFIVIRLPGEDEIEKEIPIYNKKPAS